MTFCWLKGAADTLRSFIRNQASSAMTTSSGTQRNAPFWSQMSVFAFASCCGRPAGAPSTAAVTTSGATSWTTLTPRLPRPPLRPLALPFSRLGKKKPMFAIEEAKLAPPIPQTAAIRASSPYGVPVSWSAKPSHNMGTTRMTVLNAVNFRSPKFGPMKVYRIRKVPPVRPGMAVSQNSCDLEKPKPTSFSLTTVTDQTCQTTKPSISAGTETQRLRRATVRPVDCQKSSSSGRQSPMVAPGR